MGIFELVKTIINTGKNAQMAAAWSEFACEYSKRGLEEAKAARLSAERAETAANKACVEARLNREILERLACRKEECHG